MISRATLALDRFITLLLALLLGAVGGLAIWWWSGTSGLPGSLNARIARDVVAASWWPAAAAGLALVLVLLGLRLISAHLRRTTVPRLLLKGSGRGGRLEVATSKLGAAAAEAFADVQGVRSASGRVVRDRGQAVVRISATIDRDADLAALARHADQVAADLARVIERDDLRCSVELKVAGVTAALGR